MKKAYEFTRDDRAKILYHAQAHLHEAIETLRAFRSVQELDFDPESKRENAGFWEMYALLYKAYDSILGHYDYYGETRYVFFGEMETDRKRYHEVFHGGDFGAVRDMYIEFANEIISGKHKRDDHEKQ